MQHESHQFRRAKFMQWCPYWGQLSCVTLQGVTSGQGSLPLSGKTPDVPSTCEPSDWGKHSTQINKLSHLKSSFNSVLIKTKMKKTTEFLFTPLSPDSGCSCWVCNRDADNCQPSTINRVMILTLSCQKHQSPHFLFCDTRQGWDIHPYGGILLADSHRCGQPWGKMNCWQGKLPSPVPPSPHVGEQWVRAFSIVSCPKHHRGGNQDIHREAST